MTILTAQVAQVKLGLIQIEGIMDENGLFYISVPQIADMFCIDKNQASRNFKALLDNDSSFAIRLRIMGDKNRNYSNALNLKNFRRLMLRLAIKGNKSAEQLSEALIDMGLEELFNDAFNIPNTLEGRQKFLLEWQSNRSELRDSHSIMCLGCESKGHPGAQVHDYMTTLIFGETAAAARMKTLIDEEEDAAIGLNYQDDIPGMQILTNVKWKYARKRKGSWQEQVERSVEEVKKEMGLVR